MVRREEDNIKKNTKKLNKPIQFIIALIGIFILVIVVIVLASYFTSTGTTTDRSRDNSNCRYVDVPYETQEEYLKTEYYTETVPYTDTVCDSKSLVYKKETGSCQQRQSGLFGLGDQPAKYSCIITNLDTEGGTFSMRLGFSVGGQTLDTTVNKYIYPQSSETFSYEADASIDGCYCYEGVPTKQVCRDVIKYEEVQKSRQVTAYSPVTKYRSEWKCD